ncbi:Tn3 family transposase [Streptosporangium sandarakinum]|uniref:Tn3 transposase DDE domain-containing protein n=1 Tax=Streptosporangium sandarakinum TaxID=1260955 RepID=A0A852V242_9ACTN|nr:Tn3 family transposase [Streptosporangium sandarakinum]NYF41728.1 hypothetical protein [Streptosporangium sandarakinum]
MRREGQERNPGEARHGGAGAAGGDLRKALYPVVGERTLEDIIAEAKANEKELRREIHEGLNVVEKWDSANKDVFYGKAGDPTGGDREHVEVSALALHLVQAAVVYLNTRMVQIVPAEPKWRKRLTDADRRGLSALFWSHLNLYGKFELDMSKQLDLGPGLSAQVQQSDDPL